MKLYEPLAVGLFAVAVLAVSYSLGKNIGYQQGFEKGDTDAFAEGHIAGFHDALAQDGVASANAIPSTSHSTSHSTSPSSVVIN